MIKLVSALLEKNSVSQSQVLLCLRGNTQIMPNHWSFPCGHVEQNENPVDALRRELFEELGIQLIDCELLTTLIDNQEKIENQIYLVTDWRGKLVNREPDLCQKIQWSELSKLPTPLTPVTQTILKSIEYFDKSRK